MLVFLDANFSIKQQQCHLQEGKEENTKLKTEVHIITCHELYEILNLLKFCLRIHTAVSMVAAILHGETITEGSRRSRDARYGAEEQGSRKQTSKGLLLQGRDLLCQCAQDLPTKCQI